MLPNPAQYSQPFAPQFFGFQPTGLSPMGAGLIGQPGAYGTNGQLQHPYGYGAQPFGVGAVNPQLQGQNPFQQLQTPFGAYGQSPYGQSVGGYQLGGYQGTTHPAQYGIQLLSQLAQQIFTHSAVTQQTGITIQQIAQQLAQLLQQGLAFPQTQTFGSGLPLSAGYQPLQSPFGQPVQGAYGGFGPQSGFGQPSSFGTASQGWGPSRPTIQ